IARPPVGFSLVMNLEDHFGDIIRKARQASDIPLEVAAAAAGLSEAEQRACEKSGHVPNSINVPNLARTLGLHPGKLQSIADGWVPPAPNLGLWRELRVIATERNGNAVNCYLAWDEVSREAALFDTGWEAGPVVRLIDENQLQLRHLFLTHLHQDHIAAMEELRERFPKLHLHTNSKSVPPQHRNRPNDFLHLGSLRITNRATPGHAEEGVTYIIGNWPEDAPHVAVVGDTLFAGSIATGFQSWTLLKENIRSQILSLPADTLLCPGHGPLTTPAQENAHNPFLA
ncbi:MAG TPA: MBL fold metallo-hydrolase, partial [Verrucomicrobiae bacterium]|nr:MBL fold metallo-hydrolase [Verrucomicrobiae bacterium]